MILMPMMLGVPDCGPRTAGDPPAMPIPRLSPGSLTTMISRSRFSPSTTLPLLSLRVGDEGRLDGAGSICTFRGEDVPPSFPKLLSCTNPELPSFLPSITGGVVGVSASPGPLCDGDKHFMRHEPFDASNPLMAGPVQEAAELLVLAALCFHC